MGLNEMPDEILELLDDVMENGSDLPSKVSNRLLLAAIRKNYRLSRKNSESIARSLEEVKEVRASSQHELKLHRWIIGAILLLIGILHGLPLLGLLP